MLYNHGEEDEPIGRVTGLEDTGEELKIVVNVYAKSPIIFVTIGVPFSDIPIMQKVMMFVKDGQTPIEVAKKLRSLVSINLEDYGWEKGPNFTPSELYYEVYGSASNNIPIACSPNSRFLGKDISNGRTP